MILVPNEVLLKFAFMVLVPNGLLLKFSLMEIMVQVPNGILLDFLSLLYFLSFNYGSGPSAWWQHLEF